MSEGVREGELALVRIHAHLPERAARFYAALFGWVIAPPRPGGVAFCTPEGLHGAFRAGEPSSAGPELYVRVSRLEIALALAVRLGGTALVRPGPDPGGAGRVAQVLDPEGNRIGLFEAWPAEDTGEATP